MPIIVLQKLLLVKSFCVTIIPVVKFPLHG